MNQTHHTKDAQAVLLLCGRFGGKETDPSPLTLKEYNALAAWLSRNEIRPADLFDTSDGEFMDIQFPLEPDRVRKLLNRGAAMAMALEKWTNQGIWIITRSSEEYPERMRSHLGNASPPLLYGIGKKELMKTGGLAVIGSRNINDKLSSYTAIVAQEAAEQGIGIVSGGAKGVDLIAMTAAAEAGGKVIGVMAERLSRLSSTKTFRQGIIDGRVLLISPYQPEASFSVGNAMGRNKCIYAIADAALAVSCTYNKGGTWAGLQEESKRENCIPMFIYSGEFAPADNHKVLDALNLGRADDPADLIRNMRGSDPDQHGIPNETHSDAVEPIPDVSAPGSILESKDENILAMENEPLDEDQYALLLDNLSEPISLAELLQRFNISKKNLAILLTQGVRNGDILKEGPPVLYRRSGQGRLL